MKLTSPGLSSILLAIVSWASAATLSETWQSGYTGEDATGPQVLGYWQFKPGAELEDSSGRGHRLQLAGAAPVAEGKFNGALESFPGFPIEDKRHAALTEAAASASLSPTGPFTVEMWIKPKADFPGELSPVLLDKKYVAHADYQLRLTAADKSGSRRMQVILGFGSDSDTFTSESFIPGPDWQHVAFTYDAAGTVRFFRNGAPLGAVTRPGRGPIAAGRHILSLGDRIGSNYNGFPGYLDEVRISQGTLEFRPMAIEFHSSRWTLRRMEKAEPVTVLVRNLTKATVQNLTLRVAVDGMEEQRVEIAELPAGGTHTLPQTFDTSLRPDSYRIVAHLEMHSDPPFTSEESATLTLVPRPLPRMPVLMWGLGSPSSVRQELPRLKDLGFTHCLGGGAEYDRIWEARKPIPPWTPDVIAETQSMLDLTLANDLGIAFSLSPGGWLKNRPELQRVGRDGKPYGSRADVNAALPGLTDFCFNVGASVAQAYSAYPAWEATLINTESRDSSQLSFSDFDREAYRKFSGTDIPPEAMTKSGVDWTKLKEFPKDRVIPDDHPLLRYYRWFWTVGDGWNALHTAVHRGLHSTGREDMWTWFDPAIRAPSVGGSGGEVDVLGQWTYTNPDPLRIGYFTDEMFAMAANSPQHPQVMKMTQLFWYRSQTAPKKEGASHIASPFDDHDPDAAYITISPMHLRESFWTKLARPIRGIMYHGWQALVPSESTGGYRYTNPDTKEEFRRLHRNVLEKLGPALLQIGERPRDIAYLDSFTSQMFARRGSYGYSGEEAYLTLLHAQLQPQVVYEDQVLKEGLDAFKVLVLADCDVLPASVVSRILAFQKRGGLVVGDDNLAPGVTPDIRIAKIIRTKKGVADHAAILANAAKLRAQLDTKYTRPAVCDNPEIVTRVRRADRSDYVFLVNDYREPGTYVGQHGMVMENGLPSSGTVTFQRDGGAVYDLVSSREVPATSSGGQLSWKVDLAPCDGRIYLITPSAIHETRIQAPHSVPLGARMDLEISLVNCEGEVVASVVPLKVEISDPAGRLAEFSGYHATQGGKLALHLQLAPNDAPGLWEIKVQELASGKESTAYCRMTVP